MSCFLLYLFEQDSINSEDHSFLDYESGLALINFIFLVMHLVIFNRVVGNGLTSLQEHNTFLDEEDVSGLGMCSVNNFFPFVNHHLRAGSQIFREVVAPYEEGAIL